MSGSNKSEENNKKFQKNTKNIIQRKSDFFMKSKISKVIFHFTIVRTSQQQLSKVCPYVRRNVQKYHEEDSDGNE